jgi:hypothetical protein
MHALGEVHFHSVAKRPNDGPDHATKPSSGCSPTTMRPIVKPQQIVTSSPARNVLIADLEEAIVGVHPGNIINTDYRSGSSSPKCDIGPKLSHTYGIIWTFTRDR